MALNLKELATSNKIVADAMFALEEAGTSYQLPEQAAGIIAEHLNKNNPFSAYTKGIKVVNKGAGTVKVEYDVVGDIWKDKTQLGSGTPENVTIPKEIFVWNEPQVAEEALSAYDINRGTPNTLVSRMENRMTKFVQESTKAAFAKLTGIASQVVAAAAPAGASTVESAQAKYLEVTNLATRLVKESQFPASAITITVEPTVFNQLALAGLVGDRAEKTFTGGAYSVGIMGGFRIQSGDFYLPVSGATVPAAGGATITLSGDVQAIVAVDTVAFQEVDVVAANLERMGASNDMQTYLENASIEGVLDYDSKFQKTAAFVLLSA